MRRTLMLLGLAAAIAAPSEAAAQITGTYTVAGGGSVGGWFLDFVFTNHSSNTYLYYIFGGNNPDLLTNRGSPSGWGSYPSTCSDYGSWGVVGCPTPGVIEANGIGPGQSLGGFGGTLDNLFGTTPLPNQLSFLGETCQAGGFLNCATVDFQATLVSVPEPSTYLLLVTGMLGLGLVAYRRREILA